jgi:antirestriction protein
MEHPPLPPNGSEQSHEANSYGTHDPEKQARIERARSMASRERRRDRDRLEGLVDQGMSPDDAEALIEFEHYVQDQREQTAQTPRTTELAAAMSDQPLLDDDHCCRFCEAHFSEPCAPECPRNREETARQYQPRIYVATLASNERDAEHGHWIDANQTADELRAAIAETPGWAIQACEAFAGLDVNGFTDLDLVTQLAQGVAEHGAAFAAFVQIVGTNDRDQLDKFEDFYVGSYDSPEAWARSIGEDLEWDTHLDQVVDPMLRPYLVIDYARFAQEQRQAWDVLQGVDDKTHVFMR